MVPKDNLSEQENEREDIAMTKEIFENSPLDAEEQWIEDHFDEFVPSENQDELRKELMEAARRNVEARKTKNPVTINLDSGADEYGT